MLRLKLHWQILIALGLAIIAAWLIDPGGSVGSQFVVVLDVIGQLFMNALKMIIVPLIVSSLIVGVAAAGGTQGLGRLAGKTVLYYMVTSLLAILVGLVLVNLLTPGIVHGVSVKELVGATASQVQELHSKLGGRDASSLLDVLLSLFPPNIIAAATNNGQMLGVIVFSLMYGFFLTRISEAYAEAQYNFWHGMQEIMMKIIELIMRVAPLGVFALVTKVLLSIPANQWEVILQSLGLFTVSVLAGLAIHMLITLPLLMSLLGRVNPWRHYQAMAPALLTAFSTASSSATLPVTMECVQKNAGVSERTASFVLPLGATVNMDGTALYECAAAMFIAQAYGIEISYTTQFIIVLIALLTSIGVAGIPAASLVAISIILTSIGLPLEGIALLFATDRLLDMCRTSVNIFSDSCGAVIIARTEGEDKVLQAVAA